MSDISAEDLKNRITNGEELNIIDVREEWEYEEKNINGRLIPLGDLPTRISELEDNKEELKMVD